MFAGPNGSGKSTLKTILPAKLLGVYLNADEIERELRANQSLDLTAFETSPTAAEAKAFFRDSVFLKSAGISDAGEKVSVTERRLRFQGEINSYIASVTADLIRQSLLKAQIGFSLETVMSHPSKVLLLEQARQLGYRTYLYFIATDNPKINLARVKARVQLGGHSVPEEKTIKRYHASLGLLINAIRHTHRAYIFDNSREAKEITWLAEITDGRDLEMKSQGMPDWFKHAVWDKFTPVNQ
jgi:predicted ABC-type ATPase